MDEWMADITARMLDSKLRSMRVWMDSPAYKAGVERRRAWWAAKPWYERAWIRATVKARNARIWLGEKIAGRDFNDDY